MQTYRDATWKDGDTLDQRMSKLYLQVCSVGEQLYSAGSAVAELRKKFDALEPEIANFRRELAKLIALERQRKTEEPTR